MNKNVRIAKQLIKLAKSLIASNIDKNNEKEVQKYFDEIENILYEQIKQMGWELYDYAWDIDEENDNGDFVVVGRHVSVIQSGDDAISWQEIKKKIDGQDISIDNKDKVVFSCDEKGPSGYGIIIKFK